MHYWLMRLYRLYLIAHVSSKNYLTVLGLPICVHLWTLNMGYATKRIQGWHLVTVIMLMVADCSYLDKRK